MPKVLISYSHDDDPHKKWVELLAIQLREDGIDATIDEWELNGGKSVPHFMEKEASASDIVIAICTDKYNYKADHRVGGVGYETQLFSAQNMKDIKKNKVIPVVRNVTSKLKTPVFLDGMKYFDMSVDEKYEEIYLMLYNDIVNLHINKSAKPPLGSRIDIADEDIIQRLSKIEITDDGSDHVNQIKYFESYFLDKNYRELSKMLSEYGRTWIESVSACEIARPLLKEIIKRYSFSGDKESEPNFVVCFLWSTYLYNIHLMFSKTRSNVPTENPYTNQLIDLATEHELRDLFYAERMEYSRKSPFTSQKHEEILGYAQTLLYVLREYLHNRKDIESMSNTRRYSLATAAFILAKYLKSGGLMDEAQDYFKLSKLFYNKDIPSHKNEISHCEYALDLIDLVQNSGKNINFKRVSSQSFVLGLQLLSEGNYYWINGYMGNAIATLEKAEEVFKKLRYNNYESRANVMIQAINLFNYKNKTPGIDINALAVNSGFGDKLKFFMGEVKITKEIAEWVHSSDIIKVASCAQFYDLSSKDKRLESFGNVDVKRPLKLVIKANLFLSYEDPGPLVQNLNELYSDISDMNFNKPLPLVFGG
jgi:hypothetical protein